jgi:hypothetical protein
MYDGRRPRENGRTPAAKSAIPREGQEEVLISRRSVCVLPILVAVLIAASFAGWTWDPAKVSLAS